MKTTTQQHLDALRLVEGDSQFDGIATSVKAFRSKHRSKQDTQSSTFAWIQTSRELSALEQTTSAQLERMQNDMGLMPSPRCGQEQNLDAMSLVSSLKDDLNVSQHNKPRCRKDTQKRLREMEEELEQKYAALEAEIKLTLQLVSVSNESKQCCISPIVLKALNSLRTLDEASDEVEFLKQELMTAFNDQSTKGARRRYKQIEKEGLEEVERLRKRIIENARRRTNKTKNETKQLEMHAKLKLLRLKHQLRDTHNQQEPDSKVAEEKVIIDLQQRLEARQALSKHRLEQVQDDEKENTDVLIQQEIMKQRNKSFNKERSGFRVEQRQNKLQAQQEAEEKQKRERESQLERLSALALSCSYQKKIADLQPDIHKSTNARQNDFFRRQSDLADFQLGRHRSFTDEKLFSDPKFRLSNALHEAGINKTIAARDVIRNAIPRTEERTTGIKPY